MPVLRFCKKRQEEKACAKELQKMPRGKEIGCIRVKEEREQAEGQKGKESERLFFFDDIFEAKKKAGQEKKKEEVEEGVFDPVVGTARMR